MKLDIFLDTLTKNNLNYFDFIKMASQIEEISEIFDIKDLENWRFLGLDILKTKNGKISLATRFRPFKEQIFCAVDIETSGNNIQKGQIIEIGATKFQNEIELERFKTFVKCDLVPNEITELTGICADDLKDAPNLKEVLEKFRLFLKDAVFIAHNVNFDYNFINDSFKKFDMGILLNSKICTINLSRRTIPSQKYGLSSLKEILNINSIHHRALSDALAAKDIFIECTKRLPWTIETTQDLINFSKFAKCLKISSQTKTDNII